MKCTKEKKAKQSRKKKWESRSVGHELEKKKVGVRGGEGVGNEMLVAEKSKDGGSVRVFFFFGNIHGSLL